MTLRVTGLQASYQRAVKGPVLLSASTELVCHPFFRDSIAAFTSATKCLLHKAFTLQPKTTAATSHSSPP